VTLGASAVKTSIVRWTWRGLVFALLGSAYAALQIHQSLDQGHLAYPATYDDNGYFGDALSRLHLLYDRGLLAFGGDWWRRAPHSPWSAAVAVAGFGLFGPQDWAPALANGATLVLLLLALAWVTRNIEFVPATLIAVASLSWPFVGNLLLEFRPDMIWGICLAAFVAQISMTATSALSRAQVLAAGALLTVALLAKTSTAPVTAAIVAAVVVSVLSVRWYFDRSSLRPTVRSLAQIAGLAALLSLPHYVVTAPEIYRYIYQNVFGDLATIWELNLGPAGHLLYHLTGWGGRVMLGPWLWLWLFTLVLFAVSVRMKKDLLTGLRACCYSIGFGVAFAAVTIPAHKSPFIGAIVPACFLVSWVLMAAYVVRSLEGAPTGARVGAIGVLAAITLAGLATFEWHSAIGYGSPTRDRFVEIRKRHSDIKRVLDAVARSGPEHPRVFVLGTSKYLNAGTLQYYALTRRLDGIRFIEAAFAKDPDAAIAQITSSDGVLLFTDDNGDVFRGLPSGEPKYLDSVASRIAHDASFRLIEEMPSFTGKGVARLYLRTPPFMLGGDEVGFWHTEGPYPQWNLERVRWGLGPASRFRVPNDGGPATLMLEGQTPFSGQVVTMRIDGADAQRYTFQRVGVPEEIRIDLPLTTKSYWEVELIYSQWAPGSAADPRNVAVLWRRIQWRRNQ
jgi:hypothetical protein